MGYLAQSLLLSCLLYSGGFMGGLGEAGAPPNFPPHPIWMIPIINLKLYPYSIEIFWRRHHRSCFD